MNGQQVPDDAHKRKLAYLQAAHAVAAVKLLKRRQLVRVSITPKPHTLACVETRPIPGKPLSTLEDLLIDLRVALASRAAEELLFSAEPDQRAAEIAQPLRMAQAIITRMGLTRSESELLNENLGFARQFVDENRSIILTVAEALVARSELSGKDVEALVNSPSRAACAAAGSG